MKKSILIGLSVVVALAVGVVAYVEINKTPYDKLTTQEKEALRKSAEFNKGIELVPVKEAKDKTQFRKNGVPIIVPVYDNNETGANK